MFIFSKKKNVAKAFHPLFRYGYCRHENKMRCLMNVVLALALLAGTEAFAPATGRKCCSN
jgi:hypothetical protein